MSAAEVVVRSVEKAPVQAIATLPAVWTVVAIAVAAIGASHSWWGLLWPRLSSLPSVLRFRPARHPLNDPRGIAIPACAPMHFL